MKAQDIKVGRHYTDRYLGVVKILEVNPIENDLRISTFDDSNTYGLIVNEKGGHLFSLSNGAMGLTETGSMKERLANGLSDALVSRGKAKGMLKKKSPPVNTVGAAVWQALQSCSNPYKVGFCHLMFMDEGNKQVYDYIIQLGEKIDLSRLDRDSNLLKDLGVW